MRVDACELHPSETGHPLPNWISVEGKYKVAPVLN
jgi:hypothetical protein